MESQSTAQSVRNRPRALVLASSADVAANDLCVDLLSSASPERQRVLSLSYTRRPTRLVDHWRATHDALPASMAIVCPESHADGESPDGVHTTHVPASDLTGASIAISRYLDRWDGDGEPITVCLNSLTSLLQYADRDRVFRFLHTITSRCLAVDASVHAHLDPATQDEQTVATIATLFDTVVRREDDEGWTVQQ
ncbi:DUF7504 family protein [Halorientalis regularis]|jgi:hypothetical protein|uniref:RecA-superfamily ATPase, KaiC/GvpD/RAD55 family n=1 Tax=Halorientalis regularis TaxID=660518 RepID=A0A1G7J902_9EURY|nr:hypothetical protein [Halorientalis regularis]SDF20969.1 hypothetical protein SAMN05216218_104235 [Halorientalis regularis]